MEGKCLLMKQEGEITAVEVKSAMTYDNSFAGSLRTLPGWVGTPVRERAVVYAGDFQNVKGDVKVVNFRDVNALFPGMQVKF